MIKKIFHTITRKLWPQVTAWERQWLGECFFLLVGIQIFAIILLLYQLFSGIDRICLTGIAGLIVVAFLAIACLLNRKTDCVLNTAFTIPFLVYFCYISDFSVHTHSPDAIYHSVSWLLAGAFFLLYFSGSKLKTVLYGIVSTLTITFQLLKSAPLSNLFDETGFIPAHPLPAFIIVVAGGLLLRLKFDRQSKQFWEKLRHTRNEISSAMHDTSHPVAKIAVMRDETGNVINLKISKVNRAFESTFKIQLREVLDQEARFILELVLKEPFDLNSILLGKNQKTKEFFARKLDLWFKIHLLKPSHTSWYVIFENITRAKKKLSELEISKRRYKVLLEAIPDMFFVLDKEGTYEDFVIKESDLFKVEEANIVGQTIFDVGFPPKMAEKILTCIHACLNYNSLETIEYSLDTPNGTYLFEMRLAKLDSKSVISVSRDITRRKHAEFELDKARIKAEESDRLKSAFLANLSHEIRTPLNIITNFTRMLADGNTETTERTEFSNAIIQNGNQLLNMIDHTIHLSKIETGGIELKEEFCLINPLMRDIYAKNKSMIGDEQQVKMLLRLDVPNTSFGFETDRTLLLNTMQILADNALKYTLEGKISMGYVMQKHDSIHFFVSDTGIGISEDQQNYIFSRFYRVRNKVNEVTSGSGLGLPIAHHYVRLLGGELQLKSTPGKGSTFSFTIPFKKGAGFLKVMDK